MSDAPGHHATTTDRGISRSEEKQLARSLSPAVAWPTLGLAVMLPTALLAVVYLGVTKAVPLWACTPILAYLSFAHYTLVHECVHGNIVAGHPRLAWVHTLVGWIGALALGLSWPALQRTHLLHHSHTNTAQDPDIFVKGTFLRLLGKRVVNSVLGLLPLPVMRLVSASGYERLQGVFSANDIRQITLVSLINLGVMAASIATGHVVEWLCLWFLPVNIGILLLNVFFQWLPHHPFDRSDRYGATRISLWPGAEALTLGQNLHLVHHLWPSVPFYNYGKLYRGLKPALISEGSRIEGLFVGSLSRSRR